MKRLFQATILGRKWNVYDDPMLKDVRGAYGECVYGPTGIGQIFLYSEQSEHTRLNTLIHECFHAFFQQYEEHCALQYGDSAAGMLIWRGIQRGESRKVKALRDSLLEHSEYALRDIVKSARIWFTRDLAELLKKDRWFLP